MSALEHLEPKSVFHFFEELCKIPRATFDTKRVSDYCVGFAKERGLECIQDEANNVIIKKAGTTGFESSEPVIIQGHLDMVCEKTDDSAHNFDTDPIEVYEENGFLKAKDTSLGGDDGIAIAYALAILDSDTIEHPPIEAVFTTDEEVGMGGAGAIDLSVLKGRMLINIDSEEEGTLLTGCAGGFRHTITLPLAKEEKTGAAAEIVVRGLRGGHSGIEINQQRGNANKVLGRILNSLKTQFSYALIEMNGGTKDNVITPLSKAKILVDTTQKDAVKAYVEELAETVKTEFGKDEPNLEISVVLSEETTMNVCTADTTDKVVFLLISTPYGVQGLSRELKGLVESSLNLGIVATKEDSIELIFMVRSSVESKKKELEETLNAYAIFTGGKGEVSCDYPAWMYKSDSKLRPIMIDTYEQMFGKAPVVATIHAGLECGLLSGQLPELDCVSFGPNMFDVHSVNEKLEVASVQRMWDYLLAVLKNCK